MLRQPRVTPTLALAATLTTGIITGCTSVESLLVSERGKDYCLSHSPVTGSSFTDELNYRKCLKTADSMVAKGERNKLIAEKEYRVMTAASKDPRYIQQWEADKSKWEKSIAPNLASCENLGAVPADREFGIPPVSAEDNEAHCRSNEAIKADQRRAEDGGFSDQISSFEGWYDWAFKLKKKWPFGDVEYVMGGARY